MEPNVNPNAYKIKVKTATTVNTITAICPTPDHAWDMAWQMAGSQHAAISVRPVK
jgi:hypothetical protein